MSQQRVDALLEQLDMMTEDRDLWRRLAEERQRHAEHLADEAENCVHRCEKDLESLVDAIAAVRAAGGQ